MIVFMITLVIGLFMMVVSWVVIYSPGIANPILGNNGKQLSGSISEKVFIEAGNIKQGMFIRSKNINNPVLLYLHGGPAFPNYFLIEKYNPRLEDYFTICYWEQRGGGLSFSPEVTLQSMNIDQLASDAIDVTHYLRERFGKDKIYLMAHSGGTPIALLAASRKPELYHAYIAMAQITRQAESEKIAYSYMLEKYKLDQNQKRVNKLLKFAVLESDSNIISFYKSMVRDQSMHELGIGTMHQMKSVFRDIFVPVWTCKAYTFREKVNIWKSKFSFLPKTSLNEEIITTDYTQLVKKLNVPVYFFSGKFDLTVNINLSKAYLGQLQAPIKGFYTFENSAHSPLYEEPERVRQIIEQDVLERKTSLADETSIVL